MNVRNEWQKILSITYLFLKFIKKIGNRIEFQSEFLRDLKIHKIQQRKEN